MAARSLILFAFLIFSLAATGCGLSKKQLNDAQVHYSLGLAYLGEPNPTLALKEFLLAEKYNPRNAEVQAALGHTYHLKKAYAQAEEHYLRALDLDENNPRYLNNLAAVYLDTGRYDEAIRFYREAAANLLFTSPETSYGGIGYVNFLKGDYVAAIAAYQEALARNPRYALGYFRLSEALFAVGRDEEAVRALKQTLGLVPNDVAVHYRLGLAYFKLRQKDKAAAAFRDVVRIAPDSEQARLAKNYLEMLK